MHLILTLPTDAAMAAVEPVLGKLRGLNVGTLGRELTLSRKDKQPLTDRDVAGLFSDICSAGGLAGADVGLATNSHTE